MNQLRLLERGRELRGESEKPGFKYIIRSSWHLDRLRRSRWQWFSIVTVMLVLRIQRQLPPTIELIVGLTFLILLVCPVKELVRASR